MKVKLFMMGLATAASTAIAAHCMQNASKRPTQVHPAGKIKNIDIDLDKARSISLPTNGGDLKAVRFETGDGRSGWAISIPGNRPIATPAYASGKVFVGGGYGSHEFYAFDADTGKLDWQIKTSDDGPTAAVVEDGCVAFNTESCTVIITDAQTGHILWQEWLGDPLMSQPAIRKGRLYIAFPARQRGAQELNGAHQSANVSPNAHSLSAGASGHIITAPTPSRHAAGDVKLSGGEPSDPYRLLCADLHTGKHIWQSGISADVISAPVIEADRVLITCMDGMSYSINADTGAIVWKKANAGTSAPLLAAGRLIVTTKGQVNGRAQEGITRLDTLKGGQVDKKPLAAGDALYLAQDKGGGVALGGKQQQQLDSSVGFGGGAPAAAQMSKANAHLGVNSVAGGWSYQGSRVAFKDGRLMNAQGRYLNSVDANSGAVRWRAEAKGKGIAADTQLFSPPSLGKQFMYLAGVQGHLVAVDQKDGKVGFLYKLPEPIAFQPALAKGNVYLGTTNGHLICLKTGSQDADGWTAWGGNAQHNKK